MKKYIFRLMVETTGTELSIEAETVSEAEQEARRILENKGIVVMVNHIYPAIVKGADKGE